MTKHVIINADDFGLSDGVCRSIVQLFEAKAITNTSFMIAAPGAIARIGSWDGNRLLGKAGVHLQLTSGVPLSPFDEIPSLVDPALKRFRDPRGRNWVEPVEVEKEWRRQIRVACELLGGLPTHIDSHHGVHRIPEVFEVYARLATEFGLAMRGATDGSIREIIEKNRLRATVAIVGSWTGRQLSAEILKLQLAEIVARMPRENTIEVIVHPGYNDPYLESISSYSAVRENDHSVILSLAKEHWWEVNGFSLTSYGDLGVELDRSL